jgi:hypothetical protein
MPIGKREGNRPDRRILPAVATSMPMRAALAAQVRYGGSSIHKLHPGDYGFFPPVNPRPHKSVCDDLRAVLQAEAAMLLCRGVMLGMVSTFHAGGVPKYIWAVDGDGEVFEAKTRPEMENLYHGYRISDDERKMREYVIEEWIKRC